jgi:dynein heavy chain, axonemal
LRQFPSLVNCCTIDWYTPWPADALSAVATKFLAPIAAAEGTHHASADEPAPASADAASLTTVLADACRFIHRDAAELSVRFRREAGRINYVTPTSYLELLTMFTTLLQQRKGAVAKLQKRYTVRHCPQHAEALGP